MKKTVLAVALLATSFAGMAQNVLLDKVIVINSGTFEFMAPYTDYVTVASVDPVSKAYTEHDIIYNQSAQGQLIQNDTLYVTAEDSIIQYNLNTMQRIGAASFDSIAGYSGFYSANNMVADSFYVYVGCWYGATNNNIQVYDKYDMSHVGAINGVTKGVKSMVIIGDTLYASQNETGMNYQDTAGYLAVIDLISQTHSYDLFPAANNGDDVGYLATDGTTLTAFNSVSNTIFTYDPATGIDNTSNYNGSMSLGGSGSQIVAGTAYTYLKGTLGIEKYDMSNGNVTNAVNTSNKTAIAYDHVNDFFYTTDTDFSTEGYLYVYDGNGVQVDSVMVGVSPENIGLFYRFAIGMDEQRSAGNVRAYPNPGNAYFHLDLGEEPTKYIVVDVLGNTVAQGRNIGLIQLDTQAWPAGMYLITTGKGSNTATTRWMKAK